MKIRNGFVSNSSSSSFCIYGIILEKNQAIDLLLKLDPETDTDFYKNNRTHYVSESIGCCFRDKKSKLITKTTSDGDDCVYIGRAYKTIEPEETGKQFQDKVKEDLKSLGISKEPFTIEEAFYC